MVAGRHEIVKPHPSRSDGISQLNSLGLQELDGQMSLTGQRRGWSPLVNVGVTHWRGIIHPLISWIGGHITELSSQVIGGGNGGQSAGLPEILGIKATTTARKILIIVVICSLSP